MVSLAPTPEVGVTDKVSMVGTVRWELGRMKPWGQVPGKVPEAEGGVRGHLLP